MEHHKQICYGVNSHNEKSIHKFLNFLQAQIRLLKKLDYHNSTTTVMLVGIPNVGKSVLVNSLHKIGRISAAEKGKLRHAMVSPQPCETKDIKSFKIASHPNVYVLDTPGVLPPLISEVEVCSKLALTGRCITLLIKQIPIIRTISDCLVDEKELAQYFLSILNSSEEYKKWAELFTDGEAEHTSHSDLEMKSKRRYASDHTQAFVVDDVRRNLYEEASSFHGRSADNRDTMRLIELQLEALFGAFRVPRDLGEDSCLKVCRKLLNLYRTGRLGHYTLDPVPNYSSYASSFSIIQDII
ncbi:hypothetical protein SAY86_020898 [Trapa natans]|uniref:G domain-containing protein n=1 Tax=Trapa natans TaxID=22666 RepID=A0AAN7M9I4_TRANT|nr:hypothetical protein SAY86_020898 [Trapa natans]